MGDFDDGVNAMVRLIGMLYQDLPYGRLYDDCRVAFDDARVRLIDKYRAEEEARESKIETESGERYDGR